MQNRGSERVRLAVVGGVVLVVGMVIGRFGIGDDAAASAQFGQPNGRVVAQEFGFGIPSGGMAVVKGADGGAYLVNANGMARRVLLSVQASAPDKPRQGNSVQLTLD